MGYITTWATKRNLSFFGWKIRRELRSLTSDELNETIEVLEILTGMVGDEVSERTPSPHV